MKSYRPARWLTPPPSATACFSSARRPGVVLRVSSRRGGAAGGAIARTTVAVSVATPGEPAEEVQRGPLGGQDRARRRRSTRRTGAGASRHCASGPSRSIARVRVQAAEHGLGDGEPGDHPGRLLRDRGHAARAGVDGGGDGHVPVPHVLGERAVDQLVGRIGHGDKNSGRAGRRSPRVRERRPRRTSTAALRGRVRGVALRGPARCTLTRNNWGQRANRTLRAQMTPRSHAALPSMPGVRRRDRHANATRRGGGATPRAAAAPRAHAATRPRAPAPRARTRPRRPSARGGSRARASPPRGGAGSGRRRGARPGPGP